MVAHAPADEPRRFIEGDSKVKQHISRRTFVGGLGAAAFLTASLGRGGTPFAAAPDWQDGAPPEWERILKAGQAEGRVTVGGFPALARPMSAAFKRDTGIDLNFFGGSSSEQSTRFEAEARARNMTIDLLLGGARELALKQDGLMNPIRPQFILPGLAEKNFRGGSYKWMDNEKQYLVHGAEWVFGWVLVNKDIVDPGEIKSWKDLLNPKYRGKIISHDPRSPGPGQGATNFIYKAHGLDYIKDFFLGQEVKFTTDNRQVVEEVVRGTRPISFASIQFHVEGFRQSGIRNLEVVLPADYPGYLTSGFSVLKQAKGVPHPNAATVFINWYLSHPGQELYQSVMLETARRLDVDKSKLPAYLVPRDGVKYFEDYNEETYNMRNAAVKLVTEALGSR
jgi:ABC-type Fe3+ transport system substrate-binding protein